MTSIKCSNCKLTNWAHETACKRCGASLTPNVRTRSETGNASWHGNPNSVHQGTPVKTGLAIASMVLGIVAIPATFLLVGILLAPVAFVLGIVALVRASKKPFVYGGKGFAVAGITTSSVALFFFIPIIAAIAIPNILAARRAANEGSAISTLQKLYVAQRTYMGNLGKESCGDLIDLSSANLIDSVVATGRKSGYRFEIGNSKKGSGCEIYATPVTKSEGTRSFIISNDGVLRGADKQGLKAEESDPVLSR